MRIAVLATAVCVSIVGLSAASDVQAAIRRPTSIPAQGLAPALQILARDRNLQVVYRSEVVGELRTRGASGDLTADEALRQLLGGTGLTFRYLDDETVTITATVSSAPTATDASETAFASQAFDDSDTPDSGTANKAGFWGRLRLAQNEPSLSSQTNRPSTREGNPSQFSAENSDSRVLDEVVVTGTYIRGAAPTGSPLTVYYRGDIERSGAGTVQEFLRTIPQNLASIDVGTGRVNAGGSDINNNSFFGAAVNLRGLGAGSTLVLLNGQRLAPAGADGSFVDVSLIPLSAVERIEVLSDGASAIYGADAVAGVVNFILRKDYQGAQTTARFGDSTRGGAAELAASQLLGTRWDGGSAMLVYEHVDQNPLLARQRDFVPVGPSNVSGTFTLLPEERRNGVFVIGRQSVGTNTAVFANGFWSKHDFEHASVSNAGVTETYITGDAQQFGGSIGLTQELPSQWHLEVTASQSHLEQDDVQRDAANDAVRPHNYVSRLTGLDARAGGPLFALPAGEVRASIGVGGRREGFDVAATTSAPQFDLERDVFSAYGEVLIPVIGADDASGGRRLELSLAARYDRYDDFGSATEPKIGLSWRPSPGLTLRGSFARSFRAPPLSQRHEQGVYQLISIPNAADADGYIHTMFVVGSGNDGLEPERARSSSLGFDLKPQDVPGLSVSATYFDVDYSDRIAGPPLVGTIFDIYNEPPVAPFISREVDPAEIDRIVNEESFLNFGGPAFAGIDPYLTEAFFDFHPRNIAVTQESGIDVSASYAFDARAGAVELFVAGTKLFEFDYEVTPATPVAELLDKTFRPMDLRLRAGTSWTRGGLAASATFNYSSGYENNLLTPTGRVDSWLTTDLQIRYGIGEHAPVALFRDTTLALSILNATDEDPPSVPYGGPFTNFNYDSANASPRGRFISLQVGKHW